MGRLHCTQDPAPEAVGGDMQQLNQLSAQQFSALTEVLFHFLTEPKEAERFMAQLSEFATTNQISLGPLRSIVKSLLLVPNERERKTSAGQKRGSVASHTHPDLEPRLPPRHAPRGGRARDPSHCGTTPAQPSHVGQGPEVFSCEMS